MELLSKCIHVSDEYELGRKEVLLQSFKYVAYDIDGGKETKNIQLVTSEVRVCDFIKEFFKNTQQYVHHVHVAR
jgi:dTDP-D-glucose 4,6-dehydratase